MTHLLFNTYEHTLELYDDNKNNDTFTNVSTIKTHTEGYYEVLQKDDVSGKNKPLFRLPIVNTIIQYVHE